MFSLYFTLQIKQDIKHKQKTTRETRGNLEQSFARELLGNVFSNVKLLKVRLIQAYPEPGPVQP